MTPFDRVNELLSDLTNAYEECLKAIVKTDLLPTLSPYMVFVDFDNMSIRGSVVAIPNGVGTPLPLSQASEQWLYQHQSIMNELQVGTIVMIKDLR